MKKKIDPETNRQRLDAMLSEVSPAKTSLLMLDYDGTLAPFRKDRDKAVPYSGMRDILQKIISLDNCRTVIISERWTKDLTPLLNLESLPECWGSYGIERLSPSGDYHIEKLNEKALQGLAEADVWIEEMKFKDYCEVKPGCLAFHWRGIKSKEVEEIKDQVSKKWKLIAKKSKLQFHGFDGGIELRVPGTNKGDAVRAILEEMGENVSAVYMGDDLSDEDAFKAIKGNGLGVLVRKEFRPTAAQGWLKPPQELLQFLQKWYRNAKGKSR